MVKYKTSPYVQLGFDVHSHLKLGFGSIQKTITDYIYQEAVVEFLYFCLKPRDIADIKSYVQGISDQSIRKFLTKNVLEKKHFLIADKFESEERYNRHLLFYNMCGGIPDEIQTTLKNKCVSIIGCGGIGNVVGVNLATAGVGKLILVDDDHIEISNLTRQIMFIESDVGKLKTRVLKERLHKIASNINIETIERSFNGPNDFYELKQSDLLIISGDSPHIMDHANEYCFQTQTSFLNVGYILDIAVWGPLIVPGQAPCFQCFSSANISNIIEKHNAEISIKIKEINKKIQAPSIGPINMSSAAHASLDALKYLGQFGQPASRNARIGIHTKNLHIEKQLNNTYSPNCNFCKQYDKKLIK